MYFKDSAIMLKSLELMILFSKSKFNNNKIAELKKFEKNYHLMKTNLDSRTRNNLKKNFEYKCIHTLYGHKAAVISLIKLNDGKIVSGSRDNTIKIWDPLDNYKCIQTLDGHKKAVSSLIKLNDGKIVSGSADNTIKIWVKIK